MTLKQTGKIAKGKGVKVMKEDIMTLKQVKEIAREKGVKVGNMKKENIIRAIQRAEGNIDCFGNATVCDQLNCLWRDDCLK